MSNAIEDLGRYQVRYRRLSHGGYEELQRPILNNYIFRVGYLRVGFLKIAPQCLYHRRILSGGRYLTPRRIRRLVRKGERRDRTS